MRDRGYTRGYKEYSLVKCTPTWAGRFALGVSLRRFQSGQYWKTLLSLKPHRQVCSRGAKEEGK